MNTTPVQSGEPVKPRMTASWFNSTLPQDKAGVHSRIPRKQREEGELPCFCPTVASPIKRFNPIGIKSQVHPYDENQRVPVVSEEITKYNWTVLQETAVTGGAPLCVLSGPTRAWVHDTGSGKRVTYNTSTKRLETSTEGKGQMLVQETAFPSLINISNFVSDSAPGSIITWEAGSAQYAPEDDGACPEDDDDEQPSSTSLRVKVKRRPCGVETVAQEDAQGYVTVYDDFAGRFLEGRSASALDGVSGFATLLEQDYGECQWVITWINWFEETQALEDWILAAPDIIIERMNIKVWSKCDLPDEVIEGTDCEPEYGEY